MAPTTKARRKKRGDAARKDPEIRDDEVLSVGGGTGKFRR